MELDVQSTQLRDVLKVSHLRVNSAGPIHLYRHFSVGYKACGSVCCASAMVSSVLDIQGLFLKYCFMDHGVKHLTEICFVCAAAILWFVKSMLARKVLLLILVDHLGFVV